MVISNNYKKKTNNVTRETRYCDITFCVTSRNLNLLSFSDKGCV